MRICIPLMMIAITFSVAALSVPASPRAMQKINPYLKIFYPGGDRLKLKLEKSAIIAMLRDAEDPAQVVIAYGVWLGGGRARVRLAELYRAKKALGDDVDDEVMEGVDANFNDLLVAQKYNLTGSGEARTISFAEIERQAAVLDLIDVTGDEFARGSFGYFISGRGGLPKAVRDFFSESDSNKARPTADQLKVWERLQQLDVPRKAVRRASYSFVKKDIMAVLLNAEDPVRVFSDYGTQLNGNARRQLAELYRAKKALRGDLDDEVVGEIDVEFSKLLEGEYKLVGSREDRTIPLLEIERQAAVLNLIDVTGDEFAEVRFNKFISGRSDLPQAVRDFFSGAGRTPEQLVVWQRLQQLDVPWKAAYSFTKEDIMSVLRNADDPTQVFAGYGVQLGGRRARVRLAQLYRAKESLRGSLRNKVMEKIDVNFDALLAQEYKLTGRYEARTIPLVEIERQAAVLDIIDVTGSAFDKAIFDNFISGRSGFPKEVRNFFGKAELTETQLEVWQKLRRYSFADTRLTETQLEVKQRLRHYSFAKEDIIATLRDADDHVQVFAFYEARLGNRRARVRLAQLYRAKEALRSSLDDEVAGKIDVNFNALLAQEYNLGNKEGVRKITVAEIERHAAVLDLHDVMGDMFKKVNFKEGFVKGKSGLPKVVRKFLSEAQLTDEQVGVWEKLQLLDKQRKADIFVKEDIVATLRDAADPVQVFADYEVWLNGRARRQLAQLYRAKEVLRSSLGEAVMEGIDVEFNDFLAKEYNLVGRSNEARMIPLAEIERQVAVLDILDVTGAEFDDAIFSGFISGSQGLPRAVGKFFSEVELTAEQLVVWKRLQQLDEERKAARE